MRSRKTKDLRRLPRGVRAGGLPASVHSSAGGRRGLPRWRVGSSGVGDGGDWPGGPAVRDDAHDGAKLRRARRRGGGGPRRSVEFGR